MKILKVTLTFHIYNKVVTYKISQYNSVNSECIKNQPVNSMRNLLLKYRDNLPKSVFLNLGSAGPQFSAKECQGFRETEVRNYGRILLAVLNLCVQIKFVTTFDIIIPSPIARRQSIAASIRRLP